MKAMLHKNTPFWGLKETLREHSKRRVMSTTELLNSSSELNCSMVLITLRLKIPSKALQAVGFTFAHCYCDFP